MNEKSKPTELPEDLREALDLMLDYLWNEKWYHWMVEHRDDRIFDALEVVRCHLAGIPTTGCGIELTPCVRGEGWSL